LEDQVTQPKELTIVYLWNWIRRFGPGLMAFLENGCKIFFEILAISCYSGLCLGVNINGFSKRIIEFISSLHQRVWQSL
jgi:hypothetical protein